MCACACVRMHGLGAALVGRVCICIDFSSAGVHVVGLPMRWDLLASEAGPSGCPAANLSGFRKHVVKKGGASMSRVTWHS